MQKAAVYLIDIALIFIMNAFLMNLPITISIISSLIIYLGIYSFRTYDTETMKSYTESLIKTTVGTLVSFIVILIIYFFLSKYFNRYFFLTNLLYTIALLPIIHKIEYNIYEKHMPVKNYLVIGRKEEIGNIMEEISEKALNKIKFTQYINPNPVTLDEIIKQNTQKTLTQTIHGIVITDPELEERVKPQIQNYKAEGLEIQYLPNLVDRYLKRIPIEVIEKHEDYYKMIFEGSRTSPMIRICDIIFSLILLVISSPFILASMIVILIDDVIHKEKIEIFFKQKRVGQNGKIFRVYKLKTMRRITNSNGEKIDVLTKTGKFLRKFRLNEFPQLLNVIKGDLSLVGPRPDIESTIPFCEENIPFYNYRTKVPQGITGHAQVFFRYPEALTKEIYSERLSYDLYYVKNYSLMLYIATLLRTVETVIMGRGE
ncbi:polyprenyl glycosylphosphotransferase [Petrotoga sp. HWH.PT.55.6.1]|uniref:sugar transferase n=1 Tax=unclassified Petrotoga TaxID=2620614 RepID=UPI000CA08164|nr:MULTISPECIES: sugar transferase [unclassified Petrotoga]PNR91805.1 polyprenyl glycosylphosphotransferase [Petrotoga sp. HWHPT.55.6.3]RPD35579.1 polyprenyl glycosylphosphotransferase [Petrotoga sp. HWH.PT.55.6.1]